VPNNLTRVEAAERARLLRVDSLAVSLDLTGSLDLTPGPETFRSRSEIGFRCSEPGAATFAELTAPSVRAVTLNGRALDVARVFDGNRIALEGLAADNRMIVEADCAYSRTGEGLHRFVDPVDSAVYLYSQFETYDAHRMYACFDQPDLKAPFVLDVRAHVDWTVVSNSPVEERTGPDAGDTQHVRFAPTPPVSTYITALVAGPYAQVRTEHDGIDLGLFCRASLAEFLDPEELFAVTRAGFDYYHRVFGYRYPFGKYDQLFVPEFNAGAMENAGCVTFLEDYVFRSKVTDARRERRAETILHEMAHMWFGDLVTMRWWDDLWLNESFATYMSVLCQATVTRWRDAWTTFANAEKTWAVRQDQLPSTHPVAADAPDMEAVKTNFDGITYAKGASVLKQLVAWVGQEEFLAGVRAYFRAHEYGNTSLADLLAELERASGRDLGSWSREWLETSGVNTLRPRLATDADGTFTSFLIEQTADPAHPTLRSHRVAVGLYDRDADGALRRRERVELDVVGAVTEVPKLVGLARPDLVLVNDDDLTFAKVRLDERSLGTLVSSIGSVAESLPRALCWASAWDMTRDAEMAAGDYLRLVLSGVEAESDVGVVALLLRQAQSAVLLYGDPGLIPARLAELAEAELRLLRGAEPGSGRQLAFAQAYAGTAQPGGQADVLRQLLDGGGDAPGLVVDTELRWAFVIRLAALGQLDEAGIEAELRRDPTATGEKRAATARAARPDAAAKEAAWSAVVDSDRLSNHLQAATMAGFVQPEQAALLAPYVDRYFAAAAGLWATRSMDVAQAITEGLFPSWEVSPEVLDRADAYLAAEQPTPALRRILLEGRDGIARALRARKRDTAPDHG